MTQQNGLDINNQEQNKEKLTHFNEAGEAHMVDVHAKDDTYRVAKACGTIKVNDAVYRAVSTGTAKKGDVLGVARIAGIMGAKNNSMLIPLCHPIAMTKCDVEFELDEKNSSIMAICTTACVGKTGVSKIPVDSVVAAAKKALYTGHIGDGKIFVYDVAKVVKIRTGEEDMEALQDVE